MFSGVLSRRAHLAVPDVSVPRQALANQLVEIAVDCRVALDCRRTEIDRHWSLV